MVELAQLFPTEAEQARRNARDDQGMSSSERFEVLLGLIAVADGLLRMRPDCEELLDLYDRMEREEMRILADVQRRGHV